MVIRPYNADHIKPLTQLNKHLQNSQDELNDDDAFGDIETEEISNQQKVAIRDTKQEFNRFRKMQGQTMKYVYSRFSPVLRPKSKTLFENPIETEQAKHEKQ